MCACRCVHTYTSLAYTCEEWVRLLGLQRGVGDMVCAPSSTITDARASCEIIYASLLVTEIEHPSTRVICQQVKLSDTIFEATQAHSC